MKSLYHHKQSGDIFAIETDDADHVLSTRGPLFSDDLDPKFLDYDEYWNTEVQAKLKILSASRKPTILKSSARTD